MKLKNAVGGKRMRVLKGQEPASVFRFFEDICGIPHISYHEKEISDYCVAFAKERGLYWEQDELGNVIIIKEATPGYEEVDPVIIQGHLDMVGDKVPGCEIDMEKESIRIMVEGDMITANGTTLGADNGIAVAYGLALLDSTEIAHPRLEVVLTVSEEVGLEGATAIDLSSCKAKRLINIDSEEEGVFTVGCAGGLRVDCSVPIEKVQASGRWCELTTSGFLGGHSGIEIDRGRINGNVVMGRFFLYLKNYMSYQIVSMEGGVKDNVIPKNAKVGFVIEDADRDTLEQCLKQFNEILNIEYGTSDPEAKLVLEMKDTQTCDVLSSASEKKLLVMLTGMPNGVQTMSPDLKGLVETSLNMGVVTVSDEKIHASFALRSSHESAKMYLAEVLKQMTEILGGEVSYHGIYPGWPYERNSKLRELCKKKYQEQYGKEPVVEVIHAGLECGILSSKIEGLDCISIGPNLYDVHTPDERVSIASVARVWEYIKAVLAEK